MLILLDFIPTEQLEIQTNFCFVRCCVFLTKTKFESAYSKLVANKRKINLNSSTVDVCSGCGETNGTCLFQMK